MLFFALMFLLIIPSIMCGLAVGGFTAIVLEQHADSIFQRLYRMTERRAIKQERSNILYLPYISWSDTVAHTVPQLDAQAHSMPATKGEKL